MYIGLIKESIRKDMKESDCPLVMWGYCAERRARINNLTARNLFQLHGSNAHTALTQEKGVYPTYVILSGMTGATTKKTKHLFRLIKKSWD